MRTGHLAWLTRVPDYFLEKALVQNMEDIALPKNFFQNKKNSRLFLIGNTSGWLHFLVKKSPLAGYAGQRVSGLIFKNQANINNILRRLPLHYRSLANPCIFLKNSAHALNMTLRHVRAHVFDCFVFKRQFKQGWAILKYNLFIYLGVGMFIKSTEFNLSIEDLQIGDYEIKHSLVLTDVNGYQRTIIGTRIIKWDERGKAEVVDRIFKGRYKVLVPDGWQCEGGQLADNSCLVSAPATITFRGKL